MTPGVLALSCREVEHVIGTYFCSGAMWGDLPHATAANALDLTEPAEYFLIHVDTGEMLSHMLNNYPVPVTVMITVYYNHCSEHTKNETLCID